METNYTANLYLSKPSLAGWQMDQLIDLKLFFPDKLNCLFAEKMVMV